MTQLTIFKGARLARVGVVLAAAAAVSGCGMSQITSGLGSSLFGSSSSSNNNITSVSEEQLLVAAKSESDGTGSEALVAHGCPRVVIGPQNRHFTVYEPGREGDGLAIVHRGEITKTARECQIEPGRVTVRYGFSGRVLLGPRGIPGPVTLPVSIQVNGLDRQQVARDAMSVPVVIQEGKPIEYFSMVRTVSFPIAEGVRPADYRVHVQFERASPTG